MQSIERSHQSCDDNHASLFDSDIRNIIGLRLSRGPAHADLCCGSSGRAYAMLNVYKHTGNAEWRGRADRGSAVVAGERADAFF
jgi:hypothetical protein